jgi:hypothetical protein
MAVNPDEEHLENPAPIQSENPPEAIIPNNDTEPIYPNQAIENMEVHHHAHHGHEKKTWKNYFWEFFMLFLAVFCGSIAELQIEHYIENKREKQYIVDFIRDLKSDIISIQRSINGFQKKEQNIDSLLQVSNLDLSKSENSRKFVQYFLGTTGRPTHNPNTSALTQIKSSGSLRLFGHRKGVADSILRYDSWNQLIINHNDVIAQTMNGSFEALYPFFDVKIFWDSSYANFFKKTLTNKKIPQLRLSQEKIDIFLGHETRHGLACIVNRNYLENQLKNATKLIEFLEKEYHLE